MCYKISSAVARGVGESEECALFYSMRDEYENIVSFIAAIDEVAAELLHVQSEASVQAAHSLARHAVPQNNVCE